jgi:hypothetical protein
MFPVFQRAVSDQIPDEAEHVEQQSHEHGGSQASLLHNLQVGNIYKKTQAPLT